MSALRISDHRTGRIHLLPDPPSERWSHTEEPLRLSGSLVGSVPYASDRVPFSRASSFAGKAPRPKRLTDARRANNRDAARRYRARQRENAA